MGNQIGDRCGAKTIARATAASVVAEDDWVSRVTARNGVSKDELIAQESCVVRRIRRWAHRAGNCEVRASDEAHRTGNREVGVIADEFIVRATVG